MRIMLGWMVGQISSDLMSCLQDTIDTIGHPHVLRSVGVTVPDVSSSKVYRLNDGEVAAEDALANTMGQLACSMDGKRSLRCQCMISGWSCRNILRITDPDKDKHSINDFHADLEVHKWVMADTSGEMQEYQVRSQFQLLPVEQLALAMEEAGYEMTDKVADFLLKKQQGIISSQISEDAFQRQKRRNQQHLNRRLNLLANYTSCRSEGWSQRCTSTQQWCQALMLRPGETTGCPQKCLSPASGSVLLT